MNTRSQAATLVKYFHFLLALAIFRSFPAFAQNESAAAPGNAAMQPAGELVDYSWDKLSSLPAFFPILPWDPQHGFQPPYIDRKQGIGSIADCNFTMAGFVQPQDLALCAELGLAALMLDSGGFKRAADWKKMSAVEIDESVRKMVMETGGSRSIMGYFITDEPGASAFPALAAAVRAVRKYAPGKLAYINLFPDYATLGAPDQSQLETRTFAEYLERFVTEVKPQLISYDNYMVQYSNDLEDSGKAASYYRNLLEVRRVALKYDLPFWNIVSSNQVRPFTTIPSPGNLAFQAYTTLAAGGTGVTWYTYYARGYAYAPVDKDDALTETWYHLKEINRQIRVIGPVMKELVSTGIYFTSPAPAAGLPELSGAIVKDVKAGSPLMVGEFKDRENNDYVMIVNLSLAKSVKCTLELEREFGVYRVYSSADARITEIPAENGIWLTAGEGKLLKISGD